MKKILGASVLTIAGATAGFGLLGFSPESCGCLSSYRHILDLANLDNMSPELMYGYTPAEIERGLKQRLIGELATPGQPHEYFSNCTSISSTKFTCTTIVDSSILISRQLVLTVVTDSQHRLTDLSVERSWSWL